MTKDVHVPRGLFDTTGVFLVYLTYNKSLRGTIFFHSVLTNGRRALSNSSTRWTP